jgi:hypothetical protein
MMAFNADSTKPENKRKTQIGMLTILACLNINSFSIVSISHGWQGVTSNVSPSEARIEVLKNPTLLLGKIGNG